MSRDRSVENLRALLRIPTISRLDESQIDRSQFEKFVATLERLYPQAHARLEREIVAGHSLLFRWAGRAADNPVVLMAHYDVVAATDQGWEHLPFAADLVGEGDDQVIWGRGTLDDKGSLAALCEALESALADGIVPTHDVYFAFGHDEETHGTGAQAIAALLGERGIRPLMVLDEGGAIVRDAFPSVTAPTAAIGVSEKGPTLIGLVVQQRGGHASTPPKLTATVRLARAIVRINRRPFRAGFPEPIGWMFDALGPHATGLVGWAMRSRRIMSPLLLWVLSRGSDETRALTRTTQAVTMLEAGHAANALAERATATLNVRVAVGSSVEAAVKHLRRAIRDDAVDVRVISRGEPAPVSPITGQAWAMVSSAVQSTFESTVVTPYVQTGATDSRHFTEIASAIYRFVPFEMTREERDTLHAKNERIHVVSYLRGIDFYRALLNAL
ncbi:MAG: M20/M25/M40 family metallo-hydrolase [Rhodoglobus sp.]|nr:M20/M25/M40 family metallo-hydrolase [Rhodoglobus sp.]